MSTQSNNNNKPEPTPKPKIPPKRKCYTCRYEYTRQEAILIDVLGKIEFACPKCGATRGERTFQT